MHKRLAGLLGVMALVGCGGSGSGVAVHTTEVWTPVPEAGALAARGPVVMAGAGAWLEARAVWAAAVAE